MCALRATLSSDSAQPESSKATQAAVAAQPHCPHLPCTPVPHTCAAPGHRQPLWQPQGSEQEQLQPWLQHSQGHTQEAASWAQGHAPSVVTQLSLPAPRPRAHTAATGTGHSIPARAAPSASFPRDRRVLLHSLTMKRCMLTAGKRTLAELLIFN